MTDAPAEEFLDLDGGRVHLLRGVQEQHRLALPAAQQVDAAAVEVEEFFSRGVCQLVTSVGWPPRPTLGVTQPPGNRQSRIMCRTTRGAAPGLVQVII